MTKDRVPITCADTLGPKALGGGPLVGTKLVRVIYADESGVSPQDPLAVVCAIMAEPDAPWLALEEDIKALRNEVPERYRPGFVFRASDMLSKRDKVFEEAHWPRTERVKLLARLVSLPSKHFIPIVFGYSDHVPLDNSTRSTSSLMCHVMAYVWAISACDAAIEKNGSKDEMALLFVEDTQRAKKAISQIHEGLRNPPDNLDLSAIGNFPLRRIKDAVNFVEKNRALFLQLADGCASVVRRYLTKAPENELLLSSLLGNSPVPEGLKRKEDSAAGCFAIYFRPGG